MINLTKEEWKTFIGKSTGRRYVSDRAGNVICEMMRVNEYIPEEESLRANLIAVAPQMYKVLREMTMGSLGKLDEELRDRAKEIINKIKPY